MAWKHRITEKNMDNRTGICSGCGFVKLNHNGRCCIAIQEWNKTQSKIGKPMSHDLIDVTYAVILV